MLYLQNCGRSCYQWALSQSISLCFIITSALLFAISSTILAILSKNLLNYKEVSRLASIFRLKLVSVGFIFKRIRALFLRAQQKSIQQCFELNLETTRRLLKDDISVSQIWLPIGISRFLLCLIRNGEYTRISI